MAGIWIYLINELFYKTKQKLFSQEVIISAERQSDYHNIMHLEYFLKKWKSDHALSDENLSMVSTDIRTKSKLINTFHQNPQIFQTSSLTTPLKFRTPDMLFLTTGLSLCCSLPGPVLAYSSGSGISLKVKYWFSPIKLTKVKKSKNALNWQRCAEIHLATHCWQ